MVVIVKLISGSPKVKFVASVFKTLLVRDNLDYGITFSKGYLGSSLFRSSNSAAKLLPVIASTYCGRPFVGYKK